MASRAKRVSEESIRREAEALLQRHVSVGEFSSRMFGPDGLLRQLCKTEEDRRRLVGSPIYKDIRKMLASLGKREIADFEDDVERLSGRLTVVVPKSLHAALRVEAGQEGVSLSELIRLKLGLPYRLTSKWIAQERGEREVA